MSNEIDKTFFKQLKSFAQALDWCEANHQPLSALAMAYEMHRRGVDEAAILAQTQTLIDQMRATVRAGSADASPTLSGLTGQLASKMMAAASAPCRLMSPTMLKMMAYALATLEENSRMHRIVACPTAGASGVVPGVLLALSESPDVALSDAQMQRGLLTAGLVGELVSRRMFLSGAAGGCQAEVGVATGMAAAAIVEVLGGTPRQVMDATAMAFKNLMGLVCDPVAGLVEVPCTKRNAVGVVHASAAATMALAGIESFVPLDEVVDAMVKVGQMMSPKLKESAEGGLAMTPTGQAFTQQLKAKGNVHSPESE
ncbi:MAG: L-serine ammonia-lyase, iron-sulfur-dependent, subunit alpha [Cyanobacteria bacterium HKST-UBA04]|nr:L-serine ammonia-lyase, iron-sulfur-dependent, subunit alpha [Cyanobacteria bacterium HKST-UBA04]MCA9841739.1 L-serine ammonia-lyase, iron-sulfur-dependent, subunit alpha [Cyanobacteria bacterium HKST-UBA03]